MRLNRRAFIASAGALSVPTVAGCSQIAGEEPLVFESTPARVPDETLEATDYGEGETNAIEIERSFDVAGEERTVTITNQQVTYQKELAVEIELPDDVPGAVFTTLTTPKIEMLGRELNPVADMSNEELLERIGDRYGGLENVEVDEEDSVTVLNETTTRTRFTARVQIGGTETDVYLHVSNPVESGDEFVSGVGVHPQRFSDEESEVIAMLEAIRHGG